VSALPFHGVHRFVGATQGRIDVGVIASHEAEADAHAHRQGLSGTSAELGNPATPASKEKVVEDRAAQQAQDGRVAEPQLPTLVPVDVQKDRDGRLAAADFKDQILLQDGHPLADARCVARCTRGLNIAIVPVAGALASLLLMRGPRRCPSFRHDHRRDLKMACW